ncbi:MAG: threonine synthase [Lachnoclostridium sp.]|jgi:threonine synthase|nr:threonine synthase [Lachnoclostridium sp.]
MSILYHSTRGSSKKVTASAAILKGLADDGGLYVTESFPLLDIPVESLSKLSYQETAYEIMKLFLGDFTEEELKESIDKAYDEKFETKEIVPFVKKGDAFFLELYHGQTAAFKDMALSILPHLLKVSAKKNGVTKEIVILTATSGDTGKAALAGFSNVNGTKIIAFYPKDGVSSIQEKQMITQVGDNTYAIGVLGDFDDTQTGVKQIFNNRELAKEMDKAGYQFSSANSINIGRLLPQVVYYAYAYGQLLRQKECKAGESFDVIVPTGNFGNILAAYYAKQIGIPIGKLVCVSNENKVLYDFFQTGSYDRNRELVLTTSPSMDILVSSNLERLIYNMTGNNTGKTSQLMKELEQNGAYSITDEMKANSKDFVGGFLSMDEVKDTIKSYFDNENYLIDTHTAVAAGVFKQWKSSGKTVIVSTASPYKFTRSVMEALGEDCQNKTDFDLIDELHQISGVPIPGAISEIRTAPVCHNTVCDKSEMEDAVRNILNLKGK